MKLLIYIPSARDFKHGFGTSMFNLLVHLTTLPGLEVAVKTSANLSTISKGRQGALNEAIKGFTHILFIDDDMAFSPKAFDLLKSRDKDFIAANVVSKTTRNPVTLGPGEKLVSSKGKNGIERISATGCAFTLIRTAAIKDIPAPHFLVPWLEENQDYLGEDYYFCDLLTKNNIELYIDHDAARHVWHIGDYPFQENFSN